MEADRKTQESRGRGVKMEGDDKLQAEAKQRENLMFLGMTLLASLAAHEKALMIMRDRSYLDKDVVLKFMEVPYASVIGAFVTENARACS